MADNIGYTPGTGAVVAADDIGGVLYQRMKIGVGEDGVAVDVSDTNPLPVVSDRTDNLLALLGRIIKLLESNATVDSAQRQRVVVDSGAIVASIAATQTLATVTTVGTVTNATNIAGMDREQYINVAKNTYANSLRSRLTFQ